MDSASRPPYRATMKYRSNLSLRTALLAGVSATLLVGFVPAAIMLDGRLTEELERRAQEELARAPAILADRNAARAEALAMHADVVAAAPGLANSILGGDRESALAIAAKAIEFPGEEPVLVGSDGRVWVGPASTASLPGLVTGTRLPVSFVSDPAGPWAVALAPIPAVPGASAGVAAPVDAAVAATLAALTRSDVLILTPDGSLAAASGDSAVAVAAAGPVSHIAPDTGVQSVQVGSAPHWAVVGGLGSAGGVAFLRSVDDELAVIPDIRRAAIFSVLIALVLAGGAGILFAMTMGRPVRQLAAAAGRLEAGDFKAPLPHSHIAEFQQVTSGFASMRAALQARLEELRGANRDLQDRQERLEALQTELIRQDRLAASGRLVAELTHEIRNPVANVRNCIELVRRRLDSDPEARKYADMAVEELMRMHRLSEQLLDLHRPSETDEEVCDATVVLRDLAAMSRAGMGGEGPTLDLDAPQSVPVAIPRDALMQILLNLVANAREAAGPRLPIVVRVRKEARLVGIEVLDEGPGIPEDVLPRIFDPFFTTKGAVTGVGLGLFVAEGIARRYGGRLYAENRADGGARLVLDLLSPPDPADT